MRSKLEKLWYSAARPLSLAPLSLLYGGLMSFRNALYRIGLRHRVSVGVPVVVVGNLTVGGTGKTPLVAWLASRIAETGMKVAVVSRGYGGRARGVTRVTMHSRPSEVGDEPLLLARRTQAAVFVGRDRVAAARAAVADKADVVICDDGLQHLALRRDCEIVVIDGQRGFGNGCVLPRGPLRESPAPSATRERGGRQWRDHRARIRIAEHGHAYAFLDVACGPVMRARSRAARRRARLRASGGPASTLWRLSAIRSAFSTCCAMPAFRSTSIRFRTTTRSRRAI